jgi:hypothetical protein
MAHILQPKAPNLTLPTIEYSEDQQNQMQNQLRTLISLIMLTKKKLKTYTQAMLCIGWEYNGWRISKLNR